MRQRASGARECQRIDGFPARKDRDNATHTASGSDWVRAEKRQL
jgi:hypothetical protein